MEKRKELFTTGEVAKICQMTIATVQKYCDEGRIESIKAPVTKHRRIPRLGLMRFLRDHDIPIKQRIFSPYRVLIIDDNRETCRVIELMLLTMGSEYLVKSTTSPYEGCCLLGKLSPDLVILDIRMPGLDGREMMKVVRREGREAIRVLVVTGYPDEVGNMLAEGADDYLIKPFSREELLGKVRSLLSAGENKRR